MQHQNIIGDFYKDFEGRGAVQKRLGYPQMGE